MIIIRRVSVYRYRPHYNILYGSYIILLIYMSITLHYNTCDTYINDDAAGLGSYAFDLPAQATSTMQVLKNHIAPVDRQ